MLVPLVAAAPVIDIDGTFFIQGGIYLALVVVLRPLLFTPWLNALLRRDKAIRGAHVDAGTLRAEADTLSTTYDGRLRDAKDRAAELRSKIRRDEEALGAKHLAEVRTETSMTLETARDAVGAEAQRARQALKSRVDELADQITGRILGRAR